MAKKCNRCEQVKSLDFFSKQRSNKGGYAHICKACVVERNMEYWRTPSGRVSQIFAVQTMCSKQRRHPKPDYSRADLTEWAYANGLDTLWQAWRDSGYSKNLSPSVDRKNPNLPYMLSNIRLVTWQENNDKAYEDRKQCIHVTKQARSVKQMDMQGNVIAEFASIANAARTLGITRVNINDVCRGKKHCLTAGGYLWAYS